ncbi:hypothetical protein BaRGS_00023231 [Batillaria attramentaria]|uniref:Uncharacterized protein n=1 Tax=Batillaria attramentaria TaxID=370345 RepID=A0ABD0KED3_9CAEN
MEFCNKLGIPPVPVTEREVALFATYLARRLKPSSVRQYINIVRIMHLEAGLGHPFEQSWLVKTTLRGIDREKGREVDSHCITVLVKWSKNNQFRERVHKVNLPVLEPHPLCPVAAVVSAFRLQGPQAPSSPAFSLTATAFARRLRYLVAGRTDISSHSFRRGGATWALSCGVPGEVIKVMGDWKSSAYLAYVDQIPQLTLDYYRTKMCTNLPTA